MCEINIHSFVALLNTEDVAIIEVDDTVQLIGANSGNIIPLIHSPLFYNPLAFV